MMARDYAGREARESRGTAVSVPSAASAAPAVAPVALKSSLWRWEDLGDGDRFHQAELD
jgi:hypothetical protein